MPTVEKRYVAATAYVRRAVAIVMDQGVGYAIDPITGLAEWYAGRTKTETARNDLAHIEARWLRAASDDERARVARDAELLADRVEENLPGAPQDRKRTNLYKGEQPIGTPATSFDQALDERAGEVWGWAKDKTGAAVDGTRGLGKWLLVGGGVVLGWKVVDYLRVREANAHRQAARTRRALDEALEHAARNADRPWKVERVSANERGSLTVEGKNELSDNRKFVWYVNKWGIADPNFDWSEAEFADEAARRSFDQLTSAAHERRGRNALPHPLRIRYSDTELHTWFERDRAHVELRDKRLNRTIIEWWDEEVGEAIEAGILPSHWSVAKAHRDAYDYAVEIGLVKPPPARGES